MNKLGINKYDAAGLILQGLTVLISAGIMIFGHKAAMSHLNEYKNILKNTTPPKV